MSKLLLFFLALLCSIGALNSFADSTALTGVLPANNGASLTEISPNKKNLIINGGFGVWQRGTIWSSSVNRYVADRWYQWGYAGTPSRITGVNSGDYAVRLTHDDARANSFSSWVNTIESNDAKRLIGKILTFSVYLRKGSAFNGALRIGVKVKTDSEGRPITGNVTSIANTNVTSTVGTNWTKVSVTTGAVPSNTQTIGVIIERDGVNSINTNNYYDVAQAQLEIGDTATDFEHRSYSDKDTAICFVGGIEEVDKAIIKRNYNNSFEKYWLAFDSCVVGNQETRLSDTLFNFAWILENLSDSFRNNVMAFIIYDGMLRDYPITDDEYILATMVLTRAIPLLTELQSNGNILDKDFYENYIDVIGLMWMLYIHDENTPELTKEIIRGVIERHKIITGL